MKKYLDKPQGVYEKDREVKIDKTINELKNELKKPIWKEIIKKSTDK